MSGKLSPDFASIVVGALTRAINRRQRFGGNLSMRESEVPELLAAKVPELCEHYGTVGCPDADDVGRSCTHADAPTIADVLAAGVQAMEAGR